MNEAQKILRSMPSIVGLLRCPEALVIALRKTSVFGSAAMVEIGLLRLSGWGRGRGKPHLCGKSVAGLRLRVLRGVHRRGNFACADVSCDGCLSHGHSAIPGDG